jgi:hypothetical protein
LQQDQVLERPLVHEVEAGFVPVEQGKCRLGGERGEGLVHAGELAAAGLVLHGVGEHFRFEGPGAAHSPIGGGEFLDEIKLEIVERFEALHDDVEEHFEILRVLIADEDLFGEEALAHSVAGDARLSFGSKRAGGPGRAGALIFRERQHEVNPFPE